MAEAEKPVSVTVGVESKLGARYVFPDVAPDALGKLPESGRIPESAPTLQLINLSYAIMSIPLFVVKRVVVGTPEDVWGGKVVWECAA